MTTNYHDPLTANDFANIAKLNTIFGQLDSAISSGGVTGTAGEALSELDFVYLAGDGTWYKLDSDATATAAVGALRGCVTESGGISLAATGAIALGGDVSGFSGLTAWNPVYAGTTAGGYTQTRPNVSDGGGQVAIIEMGYATSTTSIRLSPRDVIYAKRETLADDATLTIEHHSDEETRGRQVQAYVATSVAGSSLAAYASGNQDVDVALRDRTPATYTADQCSGGTATASSNNGSFPVSNAFDDDNGTYWVAADGGVTSGWVEYDFGTSKTIRQYTITARGGGTYDGTWDDWDLEYYNGSSWEIVDSDTHTWTSNNEKQTYQVDTPASADRWRINGSEGGSNWLGVAEIEMMEAATYNDGPDKLAQSFQVTGTQTVETVSLWLKKVGAPTGTLTVRIETDSSGDPSGTLADANLTTTVAASTLSTSYGAIDFTFSTPASISGSTTYWIVLSTSDTASEANYVQWGADGSAPGYASGEMKSEASSAWSAESKDAIFTVTGVGTQYDEPLSVGSVTGDVEEVGVRFDDGAGSDANTKTTFKNLTGASADIVCQVVL